MGTLELPKFIMLRFYKSFSCKSATDYVIYNKLNAQTHEKHRLSSTR